MAKTIKQKISSAKSKPSNLKKEKTIEVISKPNLTKINKIIVNQAEKTKATGRTTGATEQSTIAVPKNQKGIKYTYTKGLEKAVNTAVKQGRSGDVQRIKASQAVDASKTAMRAKMIESRLKAKKKK
jgi:hypothetical protein